MDIILSRIKSLEADMAIYEAVLKQRNDRKIGIKYRSASQTLQLNISLYKQVTGKSYNSVLPSIKSIPKEFKVKMGPLFANGNKSRELYVNGILYKNLITLTEAKKLMESLT